MVPINLESIRESCERFRLNVDDIATFYLSARMSAELMCGVEKLESSELELHVSDDFPRSWTTIRTPKDVVDLYEQGEFERLNAYQSLVSVCSAFEALFSELHEISDAPTMDKVVIRSYRRKGSFEIRNKAACSVRAIHEHLGLNSPLNFDSAICWIYNYFLLRNIVVHERGMVTSAKKPRIVGELAETPVGGRLQITSNKLDDLFNFTKDHVSAFEARVTSKYEEQSVDLGA
ncbi:hypothetical protein ACQUWM_07285 [Marinobacter sp. DUT-3]|uniref:hypothetical protein n=1 Tax=Marinobacter sp. DUT-3 TaxID=3412036 RepID=UPI003D165E36